MRAEGVKGQNTHGFAGVETRDTPMSASGPIRKTWGGGGGGGGVLSTLGPTRKAGRGEGCCPLLARFNKRGKGGCPRYEKWGGCLAEEGAVLLYKRGGGGCNPQTPPPDPPLVCV